MEVVLVIHMLLALAIIGLVLMQRSEGGGLGIGGNSGGAGNFASARGTANFLTRATAICAAGFFATSLILGVLAGRQTSAHTGILSGFDDTKAPVAGEAPVVPAEGDATEAKAGEASAPTAADAKTDTKVDTKTETKSGEADADGQAMPEAPIAE